jgi:uridine kinase
VSEDALARAAAAIAELPRDRRTLVAIDGVDGAGKTTFADRLAPRLDRPVVRASEDDFLNPAAVRHRRGRESPEGFFRDSYDLAALERLLLDPFAAGGPFRRRAFDVLADAPVVSADEHAPPGALLLLDGLFLQRDELCGRWDLSILLDVPEEVAAARLLEREGKPTRDRYVLGNRLYFEACDPRSRASLVLPW